MTAFSASQFPEDACSVARRFGGIARLYGNNALAGFQNAHIAVLGLGGVGSWAVDALARSGIGTLTIVDLDHVAESNINRQLLASSATLGLAKVTAMTERVRDINPYCRIHAVEDFVRVDNLGEVLLPGFDYVIDCIDNFRTKAAIIHYAKRQKIKLITMGGAGGLTDPTQVRIADLTRSIHDPLFARTRKLLRLRYGFSSNPKRRFDVPCVFSDEQPVYADGQGGVSPHKPQRAELAGLNCASGIGSVVTVTATFGLVAVSHVLRKLAERAGES